jgi:sugar-phosphatase
MKPEAFFFDLDGTLVDTEILWATAMSRYLAHRGFALSENEVLKIVFGRSWKEIYCDITAMFPGLGDVPIDEMSSELRVRYAQLCPDPSCTIITDSVACLKRVAARAPCAIVSGSCHNDIENAVKLMGCVNEISAVFGAEDYLRGKPHPDGFLAAAKHFNVNCANCVVFEDSPAGIKAAKNAGMYCVALKRNRPRFAEHDIADQVLDSLADFSI